WLQHGVCRVRPATENYSKTKKEVLATSTCKSTTTERAVPQVIRRLAYASEKPSNTLFRFVTKLRKYSHRIPNVARTVRSLLRVTRYLATGSSFHSLHYEYLLGATTIREIVRDTCEAIWECLRATFMSQKSEKDWLRIANEFYERTNFPNCLGAADGKHITICKPHDSGSLFFNYNNFFSTVLMALVDADCCFINIDVGAHGASGDCNIFKNTNFCKKIRRKSLKYSRFQVIAQ
ncbi:hypothetical protein Cfor_10194, partial [Coptotermes formosanus]